MKFCSKNVFSHPALLWFLPVLGLVVLIHLINMFRHRRQPWAAMEFLLAGYRKSRTRILLQQLLLMLLRTLAVAAVILALAGPRLDGPLAEWFGGKPTHHILLVDDSFSMNDRNIVQGGAPIFEEAVNLVRQVLDGARKRNSGDRFSLVRLSRARAVLKDEEPDVAELALNEDNLQIIQDVLQSLQPSQSGEEPEIMLEVAANLIRRSGGHLKPTVYFLSDFRLRNWENAASALKFGDEIREQGGSVRMIRIADGERTNLGVESLEVVDGIHAADIDILLDTVVVNHGSEDAENVHLAVIADGRTLPGITIPVIKAREKTVPSIRFPVRLDGSGNHRIEVQLQADAVPDDNRRFLVLDVPAALEILLISPDSRTTESRTAGSDAASQYVRVALSPGGTKSGIRTRTEAPTFLASNPLKEFDAVFLLDLPKLESAAVRALEEYVAEGGGLAVFFGPESNLDFVRDELFRNGEGLLPVSPIAETPLEPDFLSRTPDITVRNHPIFRLFGEGESPLLGSVKIERYIGVAPLTETTERNETTDNALPIPHSPFPTPHILATLRGGAPLVVEKPFGRGKVVTFLTTAAPQWNNWARGNPSFVVVMLELAAWLSRQSMENQQLRVGEPLRVELNPSLYEPVVRLQLPLREDENETKTLTLEAVSNIVDETSHLTATCSDTSRSGVYHAVLKERSGAQAEKLFAVNVDAVEGDTRLADSAELSDLLRPGGLTIESSIGFSTETDFIGQKSASDFLLIAVLSFLIFETFLAGRILPPASRT